MDHAERNPDFGVYNQQYTYQSVHLYSVISAFVIHSLESNMSKLATW